MADKIVKTKQPEKVVKKVDTTSQAEKPKLFQKAAPAADKDKDREKPKKENAISRWWRETVGELRKVSWPTRQDAMRLTQIVLIVMVIMGLVLGALDWVFSQLIALLVA